MTNQILSNLKAYLTERKEQLEHRCECTESNYSLGKLDALEEISNYITGEAMHLLVDEKQLYEI